MSSFLDSTGLDRLVNNWLKPYFAKKVDAFNVTYSNAAKYIKIGSMPAGSASANFATFLCCNCNGLDQSVSDCYLVECNNHSDARSVKYTLISPTVAAAGKRSEIGYIVNSSGGIDIVINQPSYSAGKIVMLNSSLFEPCDPVSVSSTGFVAGSYYQSVMSSGSVGSASQPVYVDANGQVQVCSSYMQGVESVYYTNLTSNWSRIATVTITGTDLVAFSADISESDTGYLSLHIEFRLRKISNVMRLSATVTNMSFASNTNNTVSVGYIANGNDYSIYLKYGTTQYTGLSGRIRLRYAQGIGWQRALFTTNVANMTGSENLTAGIVRTVSVS